MAVPSGDNRSSDVAAPLNMCTRRSSDRKAETFAGRVRAPLLNHNRSNFWRVCILQRLDFKALYESSIIRPHCVTNCCKDVCVSVCVK